MHAILGQIAKAKAEFEKTKQEIKSQLASGLDSETKDRRA
jgi:hypothetical protein